MRTNVLNDLSNVVKKGAGLACSWSQVGRMSEGGAIEHPLSTHSAPFGTRWKPAGETATTSFGIQRLAAVYGGKSKTRRDDHAGLHSYERLNACKPASIHPTSVCMAHGLENRTTALQKCGCATLTKNVKNSYAAKSFLRLAAMVTLLLTLACGNVWAKDIYYLNVNDWTWGCKCHNWGTTSTTWCGDDAVMSSTSMTKDAHTYYKITLKNANNNKCKFYNADCSDGGATGDLTISGNCYQGGIWINMLPINGGTFYFDNSLLNWTPAGDNKIQLFIGDASYTSVYNVTNQVANTLLYYKDMSAYGGATYIRWALANYGSGSFGPSNEPTNRTATYTGTYEFNSSSLYLFTTSSGDNGTAIDAAYKSSYTALNCSITIATKVSTDCGSSYSDNNAVGALSVSSYKFSNYNTCNTSTSGSLSVGSASETIVAGYTAATTLTATRNVSGYYFAGWYDASGNLISSNASVVVRPRAATTYYAYYTTCPSNSVAGTAYKFQIKSGLSNGNITTTGTIVLDESKYLESAPVGGNVSVNSTASGRIAIVDTKGFKMTNADAYFTLNLECPILEGDIIKYIITSYDGGLYKASSRSDGNLLTTLSKCSNNSTYKEYVVPSGSGLIGKSTLYLIPKSNNAQFYYFEIIRKLKITLDENGGSALSDIYGDSGEKVVLPHTFKADNRFKGWYTSTSGGTQRANYYTISGAETIHAQWEDIPASGDMFTLRMESSMAPASNVTIPANDTIDLLKYATVYGGSAVVKNTNSSAVGIIASSTSKLTFNNAKEGLHIQLDFPILEGDTIITNIESQNLSYTNNSTRSTTNNFTKGTNQKLVVNSTNILKNSSTLYLWQASTSGGVLSSLKIKRPAKYTISYAAGSAAGASGSLASGTKIDGANFTLSDNSTAFTRSGYTYDGWSTNTDGSTKDYNLGGTYTANANITLYPHWVDATPTHTVTASTSTGTTTQGTVSSAAASVAEGSTTTITAVPATGYRVTNWAVSGTGASISPSGASNSTTTTLTMGTANATVTVTFGPKPYTVTLNNQSATSAGTESVSTTYAANTNLTSAIDCPAKTGKVFAGYFTGTNGTGVQLIDLSGNWIASAGGGNTYLDGSKNWKYDGDLTLYACWMEYASTLDFKTEAAKGTPTAISTFLESGNMVISSTENVSWDNDGTGYEGLKIKQSGRKLLLLVESGKKMSITLGKNNNAKISKNGGAEADLTKEVTTNFGPMDADSLFVIRTTSDGAVSIQKITIESSCAATIPGNISKGTASGGTGTITLTAAGSPVSGDTWYWQTSASGTSTSNSGTTYDVSAAGTYYVRSYNTSGTCWSDAKSVTVVAADLLTAISPTLSYASTVAVGSTISPTLSGNTGGGDVTYALNSVSPAGSLTIDSETGVVTGVTAAGTATVTATVAAKGNYAGNTATSSTITVTKGSISPSLSYSSTTLTTGDNSSSPTVTGNSGSGSVSYAVTSSSPSGCITVDSGTGVVTAVAAGTGTVTATIAATDNYLGGTATADFTVTDPCFYANDLKKKDGGGDIAKDAEITASMLASGTITGGTLQNTSGAKLSHNTAYGLVMESGKQVTLTLTSPKIFEAGTVITVKSYSSNQGASDKTDYNKYSGIIVGTHKLADSVKCTSNTPALFTQTYTVTTSDGIEGGNSVVFKRTTAKTYIYSIKVTGCGERSGYTVTYDDNGSTSGSVPVDGDSPYDEDATVTVLGNTGSLAKNGYTFAGWNSKADGTGADFTAAGTFTITKDTVLYAKWTPNTYGITYHLNGASWAGAYDAPATYTVGTGATLPIAANMTNTGYSFNGWKNNSGLTGDNITAIGTSDYGSKEYWAKWTENTYTITYNANGDGAGNVGDVTGSTSDTEGHYVTVADNGFALEDHVFAGWNTAANGSGESYSEGEEIELTANMTLYAIWADDYNVTWGDVQIGGAGDAVTPNLGGKNYTITATISSWDGDTEDLELGDVTEGVIASITGTTATTVTITFAVGTDVVGEEIELSINIPAHGDYGAKTSTEEIDIERCGGSAGATTIFSNDFSTATAVAYVNDGSSTYSHSYNTSSTLSNLVGSGTNLFTSLASSIKKGNIAVNSSTGGNSVDATGFFQVYGNGDNTVYWSLNRTSDFAATAPTALQVSMDIWYKNLSSGTSIGVQFAVGDGFSDGLASGTSQASSKVHSGFGIYSNSTAKLYAYENIKTELYSTGITQETWLSFVWIINNTGSDLTYNNPTGSGTTTLANDKFDLWLKTQAGAASTYTKIINAAAATTASKDLQNLYIGNNPSSGVKKHEFRLDNVVVKDISPSDSKVTTTLSWSPAVSSDEDWDSGNNRLNKKTSDADFTFTASTTSNTLGAITYESSNTSVVTVSETGKVHMVGAGNATITATLAESGCYKEATASYNIAVTDDCDDEAGTISTEDLGCDGIRMTVTGHTAAAGVSYQWYKVKAEGSDDEVGEDQDNYTATAAGEYYVIVTNTGDRHCAKTSTNTVVVAAKAAVTASKIVDSWYVKNGRRTPDIALVQTTNTTDFTVAFKGSTTIWDPTNSVSTGFGGCPFHMSANGIIYLDGQSALRAVPTGMTVGDTTITITAKGCGAGNNQSVDIKLHVQAATDYPSVAYVSLGTAAGAVTDTTAGYYKTAALYKYLDNTLGGGDFDLTAQNAYWSVDEKELKQHYSQFDAILITDDPSTDKSKKVDGKDYSYINAIGCLIDVRPILTMEAYVAKRDNWKAKGITGTPESPNPRQYGMKLQCKQHAIFSGVNPASSNVEVETIDGVDYWTVLMVDSTMSPYTGVAWNEQTAGDQKPALQGFAASSVSEDLLLLGEIKDGALYAGVERQTEPAARLLVLGINAKALPSALTAEGKLILENSLHYLLETDLEKVDDCSNYFTGATDSDWNKATNWSKGQVPNSPTIRVRILKPCVVSSGTPIKAASVDIATSGKSYHLSGGTCSGKLTINAGGALIVGGEVRSAVAPNFNSVNLKPTTEDDLILNTSGSAQSALILNNDDGDTKATVNLYSLGRYKDDAYQFQYFAVPMTYLDVNPAFAGQGIYTYVWTEASGWERRAYYKGLEAFEGVGITTTFSGAKTYQMKGTLASTEEREITLTTGGVGSGQNIIGNSWLAPIDIASLRTGLVDDASIVDKTIYIYCTDHDGESVEYGEGETPGQWLAIPIDASGWDAWTGLKVIPAMQGFCIIANSETTLTLNYNDHVRSTASDKLTPYLRAPKRNASHEDIELIRIRVADSQTHTDLYLFEGESFSEEFDNGWEAKYMSSDGRSAKLYAETAIGPMAVVAQPEYEGTVLGFAPGKETEYTFTFSGPSKEYYLNDLKEKKSTLISEDESYMFTFEEGDTNRFYISKTPINAPSVATGTENTGDGTKARKVIYNNHVYIIRAGKVYGIDGTLVVPNMEQK